MKITFAKLAGKTPVRVKFDNGYIQTYDRIVRRKGTFVMETHTVDSPVGVTGCIEARTEVEILPDAPRWTKDKPMCAGWYWVKAENYAAQIREFVPYQGGIEPDNGPLSTSGWESFCGPIPEPIP